MVATLDSCMHHHDRKNYVHAIWIESRPVLGPRCLSILDLTSQFHSALQLTFPSP